MGFAALYNTYRRQPASIGIGIIRWWNAYWFQPAPLVHLAFCRILLIVVQLLILTLDVGANNRLAEVAILPDYLYDPMYVLRLFIWPFGSDFRPSLGVLLTVYWISLAAGLLALVGLKTQWSLLLFALGNIFMMAFRYSFSDFHHAEALMIIALSILVLSPAGKVLYIDNLWRRRQPNTGRRGFEEINLDAKDTFARWPLLLIQWMFALTYLDAAIQKLKRSGLAWMDGYHLEFYLYGHGLPSGNDFGVWLAQQHALTVMLSWTTMVWEGTFSLVLLLPRLARVYIPLGVSLHLGMCVTHIACFREWFALYVFFIPVMFFPLEQWRWLSQRIPQGEPPIVFFDGVCGLCNRFVTWVMNQDHEVIFRFAPLQAETARVSLPPQPINPAEWTIVLVDEAGIHHESDAIVRIVSRLGGVYRGAALLIWIPRLLRDRIYRLVAGHRYNWFGQLEACRVPTGEDRSRFLP